LCFETAHATAERTYLGHGVWAERDEKRLARLPLASRPLNVINPKFPPLYRTTAWRIIGYAHAYKVVRNELYLKRMLEGGEYLLKEQQADGSFLYWRGKEGGSPKSSHLLFCSANPGCALVELFRATGEKKYLEASRRAAEWAMNFEVSPNTNYNSFAVWHLCEHYRETREARCLESAVEKTVKGVYPGQLPGGGWPGHNSWIFYHSIIVRGLAALYKVLPEDRPQRSELRRRLAAALKHLFSQQRAGGLLRSCHEEQEWRRSRAPGNPYSVHPEEKVCPFAIHALICVQEWTDLDVRSILYGLLSADPQDELAQGQEGMMHLAYGVALRWLSESERGGN
jgi:hypothetical protein